MSPAKPVLMQAPVKALDPDGQLVLSIGTAAFAFAAVICGAFYPGLVAGGQAWRLWVAILGTVLGLISLVAISLRKRHRLHRQD